MVSDDGTLKSAGLSPTTTLKSRVWSPRRTVSLAVSPILCRRTAMTKSSIGADVGVVDLDDDVAGLDAGLGGAIALGKALDQRALGYRQLLGAATSASTVDPMRPMRRWPTLPPAMSSSATRAAVLTGIAKPMPPFWPVSL